MNLIAYFCHMKIEEAIVYCLATSNRGMRSEQIADMINRQRLHLRKDWLENKEDGVIKVAIDNRY